MVVDFSAWARVTVVENIWRLIIRVWTGSEYVLFLRKYEVLGAAAFRVFAAEWIKHKIAAISFIFLVAGFPMSKFTGRLLDFDVCDEVLLDRYLNGRLFFSQVIQLGHGA